MTQGRKSKTARALACLGAALLAMAAISPALAGAQTGAEEEYELSPNIPNPDEPDQSVSAGGDEEPATDTGTATDPAAAVETDTGAAGGSGDGKRDQRAGSGQGGADPAKAPTPATEVPSLNTSSSDDGGAPVLLILLAAIAAICTGVALWRMRRDPPNGERSRGAEPTTGAASESQSI